MSYRKELNNKHLEEFVDYAVDKLNKYATKLAKESGTSIRRGVMRVDIHYFMGHHTFYYDASEAVMDNFIRN